MKKVNTYIDFINEEFFKKVFNKDKNNQKKIEECINSILKFLNENEIYDWNDFMKMSSIDREIINQIIDKSAKNMKDVENIRFGLKINLFDDMQLKSYLKELEILEEYEKCAMIIKKLSNKK